MSRKTGPDLVVQYAPFIGQAVTVSAPGYAALNDRDTSQVISGIVETIAERENGVHAGRIYDMVIRTRSGMWRTINLQRIVTCVPDPEAAISPG